MLMVKSSSVTLLSNFGYKAKENVGIFVRSEMYDTTAGDSKTQLLTLKLLELIIIYIHELC